MVIPHIPSKYIIGDAEIYNHSTCRLALAVAQALTAAHFVAFCAKRCSCNIAVQNVFLWLTCIHTSIGLRSARCSAFLEGFYLCYEQHTHSTHQGKKTRVCRSKVCWSKILQHGLLKSQKRQQFMHNVILRTLIAKYTGCCAPTWALSSKLSLFKTFTSSDRADTSVCPPA